jgi:hypothetical protein
LHLALNKAYDKRLVEILRYQQQTRGSGRLIDDRIFQNSELATGESTFGYPGRWRVIEEGTAGTQAKFHANERKPLVNSEVEIRVLGRGASAVLSASVRGMPRQRARQSK